MESLEDRLTPSGTSPLDLTTHGAIGSVNDAVFRQVDTQPTGTGVINSFVRVQSNKGEVQQGYNTDYRKVQFDENTSPQFTRSLSLDSVPTVIVNGIKYREFLLDINQKASQSLLSLDELRIYVGNAGNLHNYSAKTLNGLNAVYDLDAGGTDNWIKLDARLNQGSGKGDMLAYIPDRLFTGGSYVYLYSKFGVNEGANGGFEEWATGKASITADAGSIPGFPQAPPPPSPTPTPTPTHMISGVVDMGTGVAWTVTLTNTTTNVTQPPVFGSGLGGYSFASLTDGDNYTVSFESSDGMDLTITFNNLSADQTGFDFNAIPLT